jgi:uncharacterized protein YjcR
MKGYMRLAELAEQLGIQPDSLRVQVHRGALKASKEGPIWIVTNKEAKRYTDEQAGKRGTASPRHPRTGNRTPRKPPATEPDGAA